MKIPIRPFFGVTSALLHYMAFVFTGTGVRELQEGNAIPLSTISGFPHIDWLGLYPRRSKRLWAGNRRVAARGGMPRRASGANSTGGEAVDVGRRPEGGAATSPAKRLPRVLPVQPHLERLEDGAQACRRIRTEWVCAGNGVSADGESLE